MLNEPYPGAMKPKACLYRGGEGNTVYGGMFIPGGREHDIWWHVYTEGEKGTRYMEACLYPGERRGDTSDPWVRLLLLFSTPVRVMPPVRVHTSDR